MKAIWALLAILVLMGTLAVSTGSATICRNEDGSDRSVIVPLDDFE